jgi:hypothetical protein
MAMSSKPTSYEKQLISEIRGTPQEYHPNLLKIVQSFRESVSLKPAEESFVQGWKEMKKGETMPVSELWEGIDAE